MKDKIINSVQEGIGAVQQLLQPTSLNFIEKGAEALATCFLNGRKVLIAGNGGSLCDATHFAEELTGFFRKKRKALPAIALCESGHLTCVGNDIGFEHVFSRAVEAYGKPNDFFIGLTTSGHSRNLVLAFERAKSLGLKTMAFLGRDGGLLKGQADFELLITGHHTSDRIQEAHMTAIHILIELVEEWMFGSSHEEPLHEIVTTVQK